MILASALIEKFKYALANNWGYIWGQSGDVWTQAQQNAATREQTVKYGQKWVGHRVADCSGLFYWAFKQLGGYMYHGSDTMFRKYCTANGTMNNGKRTDGPFRGQLQFRYYGRPGGAPAPGKGDPTERTGPKQYEYENEYRNQDQSRERPFRSW